MYSFIFLIRTSWKLLNLKYCSIILITAIQSLASPQKKWEELQKWNFLLMFRFFVKRLRNHQTFKAHCGWCWGHCDSTPPLPVSQSRKTRQSWSAIAHAVSPGGGGGSCRCLRNTWLLGRTWGPAFDHVPLVLLPPSPALVLPPPPVSALSPPPQLAAALFFVFQSTFHHSLTYLSKH